MRDVSHGRNATGLALYPAASETVPSTCQPVHGTSRHVPGTFLTPPRGTARPRLRRAPDASAGVATNCGWPQCRCDVGCCDVGCCDLDSLVAEPLVPDFLVPGSSVPEPLVPEPLVPEPLVPGTCQLVHGTSRHVPGTMSTMSAERALPRRRPSAAAAQNLSSSRIGTGRRSRALRIAASSTHCVLNASSKSGSGTTGAPPATTAQMSAAWLMKPCS